MRIETPTTAGETPKNQLNSVKGLISDQTNIAIKLANRIICSNLSLVICAIFGHPGRNYFLNFEFVLLEALLIGERSGHFTSNRVYLTKFRRFSQPKSPPARTPDDKPVAYPGRMWYKQQNRLRQMCGTKQMEAAELKSALSELTARIEKIRDWL